MWTPCRQELPYSQLCSQNTKHIPGQPRCAQWTNEHILLWCLWLTPCLGTSMWLYQVTRTQVLWAYIKYPSKLTCTLFCNSGTRTLYTSYFCFASDTLVISASRWNWSETSRMEEEGSLGLSSSCSSENPLSKNSPSLQQCQVILDFIAPLPFSPLPSDI